MKKILSKGIGYRPDIITKIIRGGVRLLVSIFRLNGKNNLSNEFIQMLDPKKTVVFDSTEIYFRTGHGRLQWRVDSFHTEEPIMIRWLSTFTSEDCFFDIGANVGTYTIPALTKGSQVFAFELDPTNISILNENLFLNNLHENCVVIPLGLSSKNEITKIYNRDFSKGDALQSIGRTSPFETVQNNPYVSNQLVSKLDDIMDTFNIPLPTKIKIDVDGNERMVFDGMTNTIFSAKEIYFEDNGLPESKYVIDKILNNNFIEKEREISQNMNFSEQYNIIFEKVDV